MPRDTDQAPGSPHHTLGSGANQAAAGNHGHSGFAASTHSHVESDVTSLVTDLAGKAAATHSHAEADVTNLVTDLAGKAAATHTHAEADVTNLTTDLAALPKGRLASASTNTTTAAVGATDTVFSGMNGVAFTAVTGRRYKVTVKVAWTQTVATDAGRFSVKDGGASAPTNASTELDFHRVSAGVTSGVSDSWFFELSGLSAGTHTLGLYGRVSGTGTLTLADASNKTYLLVEDIGT